MNYRTYLLKLLLGLVFVFGAVADGVAQSRSIPRRPVPQRPTERRIGGLLKILIFNRAELFFWLTGETPDRHGQQ